MAEPYRQVPDAQARYEATASGSVTPIDDMNPWIVSPQSRPLAISCGKEKSQIAGY
jgi:hypothetical protein